MSDTPISLEEFQKFREFFYRKTGIQFEDSKRYFVDKRLAERIRQTDTGSFRNYFTLLRFQASGEELQALTNLMTVNETYFFREEYQLQCLVRSILPEIVQRLREGLPAESGRDIPDPFGGSLPEYEACRDSMIEALPSVVACLRERFA